MKAPLVVVDIFEISFDGAKGVGKLPEGKVIFIPRTAPGDIVKVRITQNKKNFCLGEVVEIITPSPLRTTPKCPIYEDCGGCQLQHLQYAAQIEAKQAILQRFIERVSPQSLLLEFEPSEHIWEYRNRIEAHFKNSKWGFYKRRSHELVFTDYCHIAKPSLNHALNALNLKEGHVHVAEVAEGSPEVLVEYGRQRGLQGVFSQVNEGVNQKLKQAVAQCLPSLDWDCALDLYAGSGNFSALAASLYPDKPVHSVELSQRLVEEGQKKLAVLSNIHWHQMPCEKFNFRSLDAHKTLVILDPPRTGCDSLLLERLLESAQVTDLIYISCNPPILFRDLKVLSPHFTLVSLQGFDMFPQTMHFEAIALLKRTH